ncbi:FecR family protein [Saccharicrinis fermentans]|uniref:Fec operon regulator FecR n=1 Tax=Saccharicrinis fermentans DSM 9555 = JCM 21142 TaxID=869213 RepID=W7YL18_9BACT|nr:FecR domain-containing protein [Saccharicrinis fermentans]GAF05211.1 fec operon regulator FecR [Saccharicrinis fermentans DSM 9555 = JCM 21142]
MKTYINISKLIFGKLANDLTIEENKKFEKWLKEDPANQILFEDIRNRKDRDLRDAKISLLDKELIWKNIQDKIGLPKTRSIFSFKAVMKYAAAILIPIAAVYGGWNLYGYIQGEINNPIAQIKPGAPKAQLIYGDKIIELGERDTILNTTHNSVAVEINSGGIKYKKDLSNPKSIEFHTIRIPRGGEYFLTLSDGTKVWLNSDTEIKYPSVFNEKERCVFVQGEAYFEIAKDSIHPFVVHAAGLDIQVLGTKFNVSAYSDDDFAHVTLVEGKVFAIEQISGLKQSAVLEPSQQALISKNGSQELVIQTVDTDVYTSWTKGKYIFRAEPLGQILKKLSRWYNVEVFYENTAAEQYTFSGILPRFKNCETFLKLMEKTNSVKFEYTENVLIVKNVK